MKKWRKNRKKCDQWIKLSLERRNKQEHSSRGALEKLHKTHRKIPVLQPLFNEVSGLKTRNFHLLLSCEAFLKNKKSSGTSLPASFSA